MCCGMMEITCCGCRNGGGQVNTGQAASSDSRMSLKDIRAGAASDLPRAEACPDAANAGVAPSVHPDTPFADPSIQVRTTACFSGQYCAETFCCVCVCVQSCACLFLNAMCKHWPWTACLVHKACSACRARTVVEGLQLPPPQSPAREAKSPGSCFPSNPRESGALDAA